MKTFGTRQFIKGLWMDLTGQKAAVHIRTDADNLVTTARTTHLPEQKETIHMIQMLRHESLSGGIHDLAHVVSVDCLADCLTKASAKADYLIRAVNEGVLPNVDKHPPFRKLMEGRHKAYTLSEWICYNLVHPGEIDAFLGSPVAGEIRQYLATADWYYHD